MTVVLKINSDHRLSAEMPGHPLELILLRDPGQGVSEIGIAHSTEPLS